MERRFKKATSNTLIEYIHRVKIEAAKKNLETENVTINELMYDLGIPIPKPFGQFLENIQGCRP